MKITSVSTSTQNINIIILFFLSILKCNKEMIDEPFYFFTIKTKKMIIFYWLFEVFLCKIAFPFFRFKTILKYNVTDRKTTNFHTRKT